MDQRPPGGLAQTDLGPIDIQVLGVARFIQATTIVTQIATQACLRENIRPPRDLTVCDRSGNLVAGEGLEPPTRGL